MCLSRLGYYNKILGWAAYTTEISLTVWRLGVPDQELGALSLGEGSLPGLEIAALSLHPHIMEKVPVSLPLLIRAQTHHGRSTLMIYSPSTDPSPNIIVLAVRILT